MGEMKEFINLDKMIMQREFVVPEYDDVDRDADETPVKKFYSGDDCFSEINSEQNAVKTASAEKLPEEQYGKLLKSYTVLDDESLWDIISKEYKPVDAWETNEILSEVILFNKGKIKNGQVNGGDVICLPTRDSILEPLVAPSKDKEILHDYYIVKEHDNLKTIARSHYSVEEKDLLELMEFVMNYNDGMRDPNNLIVGQAIKLPKINK